MAKQNVTISLDCELVQKAKILAARCSTSISGLLAKHIEEDLVGTDNAYDHAKKSSLALLETGFHLGGNSAADRDELYKR